MEELTGNWKRRAAGIARAAALVPIAVVAAAVLARALAASATVAWRALVATAAVGWRAGIGVALVPASTAGAVVLSPAPALAADHRAGPTVTVVAAGLHSPRGLTVTPEGVLLVAEAGDGGTGPCIGGPTTGDEACLGLTGAITAVAGGVQRRVVTGLPSLRSTAEGAAFGPHDVVVDRGRMLVPIGFGTDPTLRAALGPDGAALGTVVEAFANGRWRLLADLAAYEQSANPDGTDLATQPYALVPSSTGFVAVDAAANDILAGTTGGQVSTVAALAGRTVPTACGFPPGQMEMDPVPAAITRGPDGAYYVGELTGVPFPVGGARIWRVVPGQAPTVHATGFTNILDLAFDRSGRLVVLEHATNGLCSGDPTGAVVRIEPDGGRTRLLTSPLERPTGLAIAPNGDYFVAHKGAGVDAAGEVIRFRP
ncbi:ScyD/ScyE family protein [Phytohabitans sp. ZYX-F-186]|uniref:ScyD/ScyE family protein n=1 Tax=Phytohabitans maris TaxID=3071409 RepID=A0ABU0ZLF5_9ACTN|nr:ScyD/ScyE family protein [Phytohabitans sp. ZYX-F-186]MDQ7907416.1 ScyD/ScyE family protein [Phytohabitans sp. ZYX-F-186]